MIDFYSDYEEYNLDERIKELEKLRDEVKSGKDVFVGTEEERQVEIDRLKRKIDNYRNDTRF